MYVPSAVAEAAYLELPGGRKALLDLEDWERLRHWRWAAIPQSASREKWRVRGYEPGKGAGKRTYLHKAVLGITDPQAEVDHVNGDPMDNRKANLRVLARDLNQRNRGKNRNNTSGFKGVCKRGTVWIAQVSVGRKCHVVGGFETAEAAAEMRDVLTLWFHGPGFPLNFPERDYGYVYT